MTSDPSQAGADAGAASIVIVGGGHAGAQLCGALASAGLARGCHLVCAEPFLPYQRPPLSKAFLKSPTEALQSHRPEAWYADNGITVHRGDAAVAIDRAAHTLTLASGVVLPYARLVLATGARARGLPSLPDGLANVAALRGADDAQRLRERLAQARHLTVLGGGFIGLEVAATARAQGLSVTVLEAAPRLLQRSVSPELSAHVLDTHRAAGIDVRLGARVGEFVLDGQRLLSLGVDGVQTPVDLLLLGIGSRPDTALAEACGLDCQDGIVVDAQMRSSDPDILALGDAVRFTPAGGGATLRLESVQNANDQAKTVAATLAGRNEPYAALPWFWSEQGSMRLQMAGLMPADGERHRRPGATLSSFSVLHYLGGQLRCVESVNAPMDHMAARKLLETGKSPDAAAACDPAVALKSFC